MPDIEFQLLADHPDFCPTLAEWYYREWPPIYRDLADALQETHECLNADHLNSAVIAVSNGQPVAAASLRIEDMIPHPRLTPWLASVVVAPAWRGRGIGRQIVQAALEQAHHLRLSRLYLWTPHHRAFYEKLGWKFLLEDTFMDQSVSILRRNLP